MTALNHGHFERLLVVCGKSDAGKSQMLRSMFADQRFHTGTKIPQGTRLPQVWLSKERVLKIRLMSPQESFEKEETLQMFLDDIDHERRRRGIRRFNYACPLQPGSMPPRLPDAVEIINEVKKRFDPERIRLVQIHPRQDGQPGDLLSDAQIDRLRRWNVEVITLDNRRAQPPSKRVHGLLLADFFDFA